VTVVGDRVIVDIERVAHGGHCVARHEGQVLFVRHAIPGETVEVLVTSAGPQNRYLRADALRVLSASPDRVEAPCSHARPGGCGGCDWQHGSLPAQRELKAVVLREQIGRLGGVTEIGGDPLEVAITVEGVPGDHDGLGWRSRVRYAVASDGSLGFRRHRSHRVESVESCPLATDGVDSVGATRGRWDGAEQVEVVASSGGDRAVVVDPTGADVRAAISSLPAEVAVPGRRGRQWVREVAGDREWRVRADGFWQVHPGAADRLVAAVREVLEPRPGEHLLDLYSGVGLFAGCLAADLGPDGRIDAVESSVRACSDARRNLHDLPQVRIHQGEVDQWLSSGAIDTADLVVLDPPRSGAGAAVLDRIIDLAPRALAYVACDPASLGRDVGHLRAAGWTLVSVRGYDLFPMTQHVEAVALLVPFRLA
jgi:tRNA/tmRNA/rRNA uracil-C5-methylase (TrmA/RlmC/RlmD family)